MSLNRFLRIKYDTEWQEPRPDWLPIQYTRILYAEHGSGRKSAGFSVVSTSGSYSAAGSSRPYHVHKAFRAGGPYANLCRLLSRCRQFDIRWAWSSLLRKGCHMREGSKVSKTLVRCLQHGLTMLPQPSDNKSLASRID